MKLALVIFSFFIISPIFGQSQMSKLNIPDAQKEADKAMAEVLKDVPESAKNSPCTKAKKKICPIKKFPGLKQNDCLSKNFKKLPGNCQQLISNIQTKEELCGKDIRKFCGTGKVKYTGKETFQERIMKGNNCYQKNIKNYNPKCKAFIEKVSYRNEGPKNSNKNGVQTIPN